MAARDLVTLGIGPSYFTYIVTLGLGPEAVAAGSLDGYRAQSLGSQDSYRTSPVQQDAYRTNTGDTSSYRKQV